MHPLRSVRSHSGEEMVSTMGQFLCGLAMGLSDSKGLPQTASWLQPLVCGV